MSLYDDKTLVAYVDGELDPREAWLVQVALDRDSALRDKVRVMRETASVLRAAFSSVAREALPNSLDLLIARPVEVFAPKFPRIWPKSRVRVWIPTAVAASVLLAVGVSAGYWARGNQSSGAGATVEAEASSSDNTAVLQVALEKKLSGSELTWTDERSLASVTVEPIRTYRNEDATFCREYRETFVQPSRSDRTVFGLACRDASGRWDIQYYLVPGASGDTTITNQGLVGAGAGTSRHRTAASGCGYDGLHS